MVLRVDVVAAALDAAYGGVRRLARSRRSPFPRSRKDRRMASRTEQTENRSVNDHYATLGVSPEATPQEIEAAYRRNALERGWEDGFWRELRDAYDVLSDPEERARYDEQRDGARLQVPKRKSRNPIDRLFPNLPP